jgi:ABC-type transport system involved in multi-copper enzyme maturation permease subunit
LLIGPVFTREAVTTPRRAKHYVIRVVYASSLLLVMCTAWLVVAGTQLIQNIGDMARFGAVLFWIMAPLQLALMAFLSALVAASSVSQEKDRRTLILLLMTRLTNGELVLGKLFASLLNILVMLAAALPVFMCITMLGGVSFSQIGRVFGVTLTTALAAGSLGSTLALWREKTFQTLAMTALALVIWIGIWEAFLAVGAGRSLAGLPIETWTAAFSPLRAIAAAAQPRLGASAITAWWQDGVVLFLVVSTTGMILLNAVAIALVRVWNPSREARPAQPEQETGASIWGAEHDLSRSEAGGEDGREKAEAARSGHVDARVRVSAETTRQVWDNPVLWREVCTWAYGRKILFIRLGYLMLFALAALGLHFLSQQPGGEAAGLSSIVPDAAKPLAPLFLVSLVIVNALAVTSVTNERDGQSLDLLLVSDLSPREFVFGKLGGVFWVTKEMVLLPLALCVYVWWTGGLSGENLVYVMLGLAMLYLFVNMLGVHCGMNYSNSRTAIGVSLGMVFMLFLGVVTCMLIMVSFSGSFQTQLTPFLAFIIGGSVGLYAALGFRNPSPAIQLAALALPLATFYSITSFLLEYFLAVFLVTTLTYGFTTAAMLMPAISEFDIAIGRQKGGGED